MFEGLGFRAPSFLGVSRTSKCNQQATLWHKIVGPVPRVLFWEP